MHLRPGINVLIDGQWGSTGKGKLGAYLSRSTELQFATADFQSNAGHTVIIGDAKYVVNHVPSAFPNRDVILYLAPASTITVSTFMQELDQLTEFDVSSRIFIHPHVAVITEQDVEEEKNNMRFNASTMKGVGAALARKVRRKATLAKDVPELQPYVKDLTTTITKAAMKGATVLSETSQGFDLSLNHGHMYPFVTSRDVTTASVLSNLGVPPTLLAEVWGCLRTLPIRVGHVYDDSGRIVGHSGPCYPDQSEMTWQDVSNACGHTVTEKTTVTQRTRRVFSFSHQQFAKFLLMCRPTKLFLNFVNYLDHGVYGKTSATDMTKPVVSFVDQLESSAIDTLVLGVTDAPRVKLLGTGPADHEMVVL